MSDPEPEPEPEEETLYNSVGEHSVLATSIGETSLGASMRLARGQVIVQLRDVVELWVCGVLVLVLQQTDAYFEKLQVAAGVVVHASPLPHATEHHCKQDTHRPLCYASSARGQYNCTVRFGLFICAHRRIV
jgi:hypothetical protein